MTSQEWNEIPDFQKYKTKRQDQIEQGLYDGRYKQKIVPDKKKKSNKEWARKKGDIAQR